MSTTRVDRLSRTIRIGDTEDSHGNNGPLEITVTLEPVDLTHGQQTVWHQPATAPQHRLSIMGETPTQGGQIQKHMPDVVAFEEGWTAEALDDLIEVWDTEALEQAERDAYADQPGSLL